VLKTMTKRQGLRFHIAGLEASAARYQRLGCPVSADRCRMALVKYRAQLAALKDGA